MVSRRAKIFLCLLTMLVCFINITDVSSQNGELTYQIDQEWTKIWINIDGSIDLFYNITFTVHSASIGFLTLPMPNSFHIIYVNDSMGSPIPYEDISEGSFYGVDIQFIPRIQTGNSANVLILANVEKMIKEDLTNQGNVGMLFIPAWWENPPASISNLRVAFVLPDGVKQSEIITGEIEYDNLFLENSNYVLFWERHDVPAETKYSFGVSFPEKYVDIRTTNFWTFFAPIAIAAVLIASLAGAILIIFRIRKTSYEKPRIAIEALGPAYGFTAVEAAEVVGFKPVRILTMILFGLILKRILKVLETEPVVRVERIKDQNEDYKKPLWYYEIDFLRGIEPRGFINEQNLARTYLSLRNNVDKKMRGYSREDTINYYKSIVEKAWSQVIQATTPQLRGEAIETNLEWLLIDEKHKERFRSLSPDVLILPHPSWYWYLPHPTSRSPQPSSNEVKPVPIQEFADNIVTGIEKTANGLVKNIEEFTNRLIPPKTKAISSRPIRKARCVCACASCACACACVSCACACAGGGAR